MARYYETPDVDREREPTSPVLETLADEADDTSVFSTGQQGKLTATVLEALFSRGTRRKS